MSNSFFEKHMKCLYKKYINFSCLCLNTNLTESFFKKYISEQNNVDWFWVTNNTNLSINFFEKYVPNKFKERLFENTFRANHPKEKIISWLKSNPLYSFDKLLYKYI